MTPERILEIAKPLNAEFVSDYEGFLEAFAQALLAENYSEETSLIQQQDMARGRGITLRASSHDAQRKIEPGRDTECQDQRSLTTSARMPC